MQASSTRFIFRQVKLVKVNTHTHTRTRAVKHTQRMRTRARTHTHTMYKRACTHTHHLREHRERESGRETGLEFASSGRVSFHLPRLTSTSMKSYFTLRPFPTHPPPPHPPPPPRCWGQNSESHSFTGATMKYG